MYGTEVDLPRVLRRQDEVKLLHVNLEGGIFIDHKPEWFTKACNEGTVRRIFEGVHLQVLGPDGWLHCQPGEKIVIGPSGAMDVAY